MANNITVKVLDKQDWLEPIADRLQPAVRSALDHGGAIGPQAAKFLHGTWLGHPLHAVLTDVPIGSWTAAAVLDLLEANTGSRSMGRAADAHSGSARSKRGGSHGIGRLVKDRSRSTTPHWSCARIAQCYGHGLLLNVALLSAWPRTAHRTAIGLSRIRHFECRGLLGGHLVYKEQLGVDHTADFSPPDDFVPALADSELRDDQLRRVDVNGMPVLLVRKGAHIYAMAERCSHLGGPLSEGKLEGHAVRCPWHGSCFSLEDGRVLEGPSVHVQPILEARVRNGHIEVRGATV